MLINGYVENVSPEEVSNRSNKMRTDSEIEKTFGAVLKNKWAYSHTGDPKDWHSLSDWTFGKFGTKVEVWQLEVLCNQGWMQYTTVETGFFSSIKIWLYRIKPEYEKQALRWLSFTKKRIEKARIKNKLKSQ